MRGSAFSRQTEILNLKDPPRGLKTHGRCLWYIGYPQNLYIFWEFVLPYNFAGVVIKYIYHLFNHETSLVTAGVERLFFLSVIALFIFK